MTRFGFSQRQRELAVAVREVISSTNTREVRADLSARRGPVWKQLADLGVFGMLVPESSGGLGLAETDAVGALAELGRGAVSGPVAETAFVAAPALASVDAWASRWLGGLVSGAVAVSPAMKPGGYLPDADVADCLLVPGPDGLSLAAAADTRLVAQPSVDPTRRLSSLVDQADALDGELARAVADRGSLAAAAQLVGAARYLLETTVDYARDRAQFGRPIGSYQAVKHQLANVAVRVEFARPLVGRAAFSLQHRLPTASRDCSAAKASAGDAAQLAVRVALQVHGAIGYTEELEISDHFRRVWWLAAAWGDSRYHRGRVAAAVIDGGDATRTP